MHCFHFTFTSFRCFSAVHCLHFPLLVCFTGQCATPSLSTLDVASLFLGPRNVPINCRMSCILKLICVLVISRPLHVLILWFEDYFMQIYAFTTAKSTRNHNKNFHHFLTYDRRSIASAVDQPDKYKFNLRYSQIHLMI